MNDKKLLNLKFVSICDKSQIAPSVLHHWANYVHDELHGWENELDLRVGGADKLYNPFQQQPFPLKSIIKSHSTLKKLFRTVCLTV